MGLSFVKAALLVGAVGDMSLQYLTKYTTRAKEWGFESYFKFHGPIASVFIASGMMGLAALFHLFFIGQPTFVSVSLLGAGLDVLFRTTMPMPELADYYKNLSPSYTMAWGAIPLLLALYLSKSY